MRPKAFISNRQENLAIHRQPSISSFFNPYFSCMKKITLFIILLIVSTIQALACHFEFTPEGNKKTCKAGEEFVINVKLTLTHRNCAVAAAQTKFKTDGIDVVGATPWKEVNPGIWTRQVKVKVQKNDKNKVTLTATRTCDRDGGYGVFSLDKP